MKLLSAKRTVFLSLFALCVGYGQVPDGTSFDWKYGTGNTHTPVTEDDVKLGTVRNILTAGSPVMTGTVQLHRMGDEAAVILIKLLGSTPSPVKWTDAQKRTVLEMINRAFEHPKSITNRSNATPNATNFLLNYLNADTEDPDIKAEISQTRAFAFKAAANLGPQ
jgi:hypothetical protein